MPHRLISWKKNQLVIPNVSLALHYVHENILTYDEEVRQAVQFVVFKQTVAVVAIETGILICRIEVQGLLQKRYMIYLLVT